MFNLTFKVSQGPPKNWVLYTNAMEANPLKIGYFTLINAMEALTVTLIMTS